MKKYSFSFLLTTMFMFSVLLVACQHSEPTAPDNNGGGGLDPTLANIQSTIFSPRCAVSGCHVPGTASPMPMRSAQESFQALVDVNSLQRPAIKRVAPNDPDNSYLIQKLQGSSGILGLRMPSSGSRLSSAQIELIREWISDGAPNN